MRHGRVLPACSFALEMQFNTLQGNLEFWQEASILLLSSHYETPVEAIHSVFWIMLMGLFVAFMVARLESLTLLYSLVYWFGCLFWAQRGTAPSGFGCDIYSFILGMCVSHGIWNHTGWLPPFKNSWILGIDYDGKIFGHFTLLPSGYHKVMVRRACQEQLMSIHIPAWKCCPSHCPDHSAPLNLCHYVSWSCTKRCVSQCPRGALGDSQDG